MLGRCFVDIVAAGTLGREVARRREAEINDGIAFGLGKDHTAMHRRSGQPLLPFVAAQIKRLGLERTIAAFRLPRGIAAGLAVIVDIRQPLLACRHGCVVDDQRIVIAQMVEQRNQPFLEQRQPMLHPSLPPAFADGLVERVLRGGCAKLLAVSAAEALDAFLVQQGLAGREEQEAVQSARGPLGRGIEQAQRFQLVSEEIEPEALFQARGENVDDRTAHGVFAMVYDRVGARVALIAEQAGQRFVTDLEARLQFAHAFADAERCEHALQHRIDRGDQQLGPCLPALQAVQRRKALGTDRQGRACAVIRQAIPSGKFQYLQFRREEPGGIGNRAHCAFVGRDEDAASGCRACEIGHHQGLRARAQHWRGSAALRPQGCGKGRAFSGLASKGAQRSRPGKIMIA